jgi:hypothetical protein
VAEENKSDRSERDAEFIGWQRTTSGVDIALFNVTAEQHPLYHSTVSAQTLRKHNLEIPPLPQQGEQVRRINDEE